MKMSGNTVLVTGGGSGIGLALATRWLTAGSRVIVCGRDAGKLAAAAAAHPGLETIRADIASADGREALVAAVLKVAPDLDVLVNNAGIQRRGSFMTDAAPWTDRASELAVNLEAPLHLIALLSAHLTARGYAAIVNVSSGLAFLPVRFAPVYAATKAALHSFTVALRAELRATPVAVIEIIPPAVDTNLGGAGLHRDGVPLDDFADGVFTRLAQGDVEIGYGASDKFRQATRPEIDAILQKMNA